MTLRRPFLAAALAACIALPAQPASATETLSLRYSATWGGGAAAEIRLQIEEDGAAFRNRVDIETVGLARFLSGFKARVTSEGVAGGAVVPSAYDAIYDSRRRHDKRINVQFIRKAEGTVAEDGPLDTNSDPLLPEELRRDVIDPLSSLTAIRQFIRARDIAVGENFTLAVYDGKRRFDIDGRVDTAGTLDWHGGSIDVVRLQLTLRPIAGFDGDSGGDDRPDAAPRHVEVVFTNDGRAIPLLLSVPIAYVPAVVMLDRNTRL
ncbi:MAG TPA: DUF3108 domain-containing protein [Alphaproteobacteria bacterium]